MMAVRKSSRDNSHSVVQYNGGTPQSYSQHQLTHCVSARKPAVNKQQITHPPTYYHSAPQQHRQGFPVSAKRIISVNMSLCYPLASLNFLDLGLKVSHLPLRVADKASCHCEWQVEGPHLIFKTMQKLTTYVMNHFTKNHTICCTTMP